ncbi:MAG: hypothetical protein AAGN35_08620 [Bacteroidota bacterium]
MEKAPALSIPQLAELLEEKCHKEFRDTVADWALQEPERLEEVFRLYLGNFDQVSKRAGWVLEKATDLAGQRMEPYLSRVIGHLEQMETDWERRSAVRMLAMCPRYPENNLGFLLDLVLEWLNRPEETVAIRVHCMQIAFNIAQLEPDVRPELVSILESHYEDGSAGFKNRAGKLLKKLRKGQ